MERKIRYVWWGVLVLLLGIALWRFFLPHNSSSLSIEKTSSNREIVVYVTGAVEKPGLVHLSVDARLNDALEQVKPLPGANLDLINPAEKLKDGQKITIQYKPSVQNSEDKNSANSPSGTEQNINNAPSESALPASNTSAGVSGGTQININTAGVAELDKLPGIGPALAERIVQYRNEHGAFGTPEELQNVSGIGPKTYEKMASMLTVGP